MNTFFNLILSRKKILKKTFLEGSDDSEDEFGNPKYQKLKDKNYLKDQKEIQ